jgi:RNA polymerase sigma factor (sigma-70 family)
MAWDTIDIRTQGGIPVHETDRKTILNVAERALLKSDCDPEVVLRAATKVGLRVHAVENLWAYANRTIFRAIRKATNAQSKKDRIVVKAFIEVTPKHTAADQTESSALVRDILDTLSPRDREIFVRRMAGDTFLEIDQEMNLSSGTANRRFRACKNALRRVIDTKAQ